MPTLAHAGAVLTVDLDAIAGNWKRMKACFHGGEVAGVVKADAYGTGAERVAPALWNAGCRTFFVALVEEAVAVREALPDAEIHVLGGCLPGAEQTFEAFRLVPVLNGLGDIERWSAHCRSRGTPRPADVHVDTGMSRLGLSPEELDTLADEPDRLRGIDVRLVMSHLACADEPGHEANGRQLAAFRHARERLPMGRASFANSAGILLGPDYHYDLARPGIALYGGAPLSPMPFELAQVVRLQAKILQVREIDSPQTVGYGATHRAAGPTRIATIAVGYADGYLRSASGRGSAIVGGMPVPIVGRVSMDLITLDVTEVPEREAHPGTVVDLIGPGLGIDQVATAAGTISYEILTGLGRRYHRVYQGDGTGG